MDDLISRQAAIDTANRTDYLGLTVEDVKKVTDEVVKELKNLPTAEPRKGKWSKEMIGATPYKYRCTKCNKYSRAMYDFCPNCGAGMREESE